MFGLICSRENDVFFVLSDMYLYRIEYRVIAFVVGEKLAARALPTIGAGLPRNEGHFGNTVENARFIHSKDNK